MKIHSTSLVVLIAFVSTIAVSSAAFAIEPIPEESGFSGYIDVGVGYIDAETNMVKGTQVFEIGENPISSIFSGPDSESDATPILNGELRYTFAESRTQLFLGNSLEDMLRFEFSSQAGVRQELGEQGIGAVSYLFNGITTEVWEDPYVVGTKRNDTERSSNGLRLEWDYILGTNFGLKYSWRDIEIDDELSGTTGGLALTPAQISLLDREGNSHVVEGTYLWKLGGGHALLPGLIYRKEDLDGDAMAYDRYAATLTYAYKGDVFSIAATAYIGTNDHDKRNPIYGKTQDDDTYGVGVRAFWHAPFGLPDAFSLVGSVGYYEGESNIDFYDTKVTFLSASLFYKF